MVLRYFIFSSTGHSVLDNELPVVLYKMDAALGFWPISFLTG